ncbi:hypothetical protein M413DRAFT_449523, partial [Hebeloma cylindrosporum]
MSTIDLSLTRIRSLSTHLPPYTRPTIHIAGTNGKGSVSALLTSILSAADLHVGRFNSPHLVHVHDSISIDNRPIILDTYTAARRQVEDADATHGTDVSSFELLTLTALHIFQEASVDIVILEVGMGGLLDATNVIPTQSVLCSALTAVDLDHQAFLGTTLAQIARHKAGIARPGRPFVLGPQSDGTIVQAVEEVVFNAGGRLRRSPRVDADNENSTAFSLPPPPQRIRATLESFPDRAICASLALQGKHQLDNLSTALGIIDALLLSSTPPSSESQTNDLSEMFGTLNLASRVTADTIERGIRDVQWPGRLSFHLLQIPTRPETNPPTTSSSGSTTNTTNTPLLILADGAHNPASARTLGAYISYLQQQPLVAQQQPITITYILALSHSPPKTPHDTLSPILAPVLSSLPSPSPSSSSSSPALKPGIALIPFTPPAGMPWVRPVDPRVLHETVMRLFRSSMPGSEHEREAPSSALDTTNQVEIRVFDNHTAEITTPSGAPPPSVSALEGFNLPLVDALYWAASRHRVTEDVSSRTEDDTQQSSRSQHPRGLVVLAGSLYLVADLYRVLEGGFGSGS